MSLGKTPNVQNLAWKCGRKKHGGCETSWCILRSRRTCDQLLRRVSAVASPITPRTVYFAERTVSYRALVFKKKYNKQKFRPSFGSRSASTPTVWIGGSANCGALVPDSQPHLVRVWFSGFGAQGPGFRVRGLGFRDQRRHASGLPWQGRVLGRVDHLPALPLTFRAR